MPSLALAVLAASAVASAPRDCLLVSVERRGDAVVLGPAFQLKGACAAAHAGPLLLEARAAGGKVLLRAPFALVPAAAGPEGVAGQAGATVFAPLPAAEARRLASLRVLEGGRVLAARTAAAPRGPARAAARREAAGVRVTWNGRAFPAALVRDAASGELLAHGRDGEVLVATGAARLELLLSDGLRSRRLELAPAGR